MDEEEESKVGANTWRVDDLEGGLTSDQLSNLHGISATNQTTLLKNENTPAYDMRWVIMDKLSAFCNTII